MVHSADRQVELLTDLGRDGRGLRGQHADELAEHERIVRLVVPVAEREAAHLRRAAMERDAQDGGGIDEVDDPGVGRERLRVARHGQRAGRLAQRPEDAAGADGVRAAHPYAVARGDLRVQPAVMRVALGESEDDEVGAGHDFAPVGRAGQLHTAFRLGEDAFREAGHRRQDFRIGVHQRQRSAGHERACGHFMDDLFAEKVASGADHGDFGTCHSMRPSALS